MTSTGPYIPTVNIPLKSFIAPMVLFTAYGLLYIFNTNTLPASNLILAVLAYMVVSWWYGFYRLVINQFEQETSYRLVYGIGLAFLALGSVAFCFLYATDIIVQRFFTVTPFLFGLAWIVARNDEEVVNSRALWGWWKLSKYCSFAAVVNGISHIARGVLNEVVIAIDVEAVWILSCAILPIAIIWCRDTAIVRGIVKRGGF